MRKRGLTVIALTAFLALSTASLTAYAGEWKQAGNNWSYIDSSGHPVTNDWRKGTVDNLWRYLNSQGVMAINTWVDDDYYVDSNGIMVTDKWEKLPQRADSWDNSSNLVWYYFGSSGKAYVDGWKNISNKYYYFNPQGEMQTGWLDDNNYYAGDDGAMRTGWLYLTDPKDDDSGDDKTVPFEENTNKHWYYFQSSGKKFAPDSSGGDYKVSKIDGIYYCFDGNGKMQTGWVNMGDKDDGSFENYRYFDSTSGKVRTGWYSTKPPEDDNSSFDFDDEVQWYYFSNTGIPKVGPAIEDASTKDLVKINGITYLFNDKGNPVYGLRKLRSGTGDDYLTYYFGADKSTSSVVKGKVNVIEGDGTKSEYYFTESGSKAGRGFTGVKNGYLFYQGKLQQADRGSKYETINVDNKTYLVNGSGKISKSANVNVNGTKYKTNSNGEIIQIDGQSSNGLSDGREPSDPVYWDN